MPIFSESAESASGSKARSDVQAFVSTSCRHTPPNSSRHWVFGPFRTAHPGRDLARVVVARRWGFPEDERSGRLRSKDQTGSLAGMHRPREPCAGKSPSPWLDVRSDRSSLDCHPALRLLIAGLLRTTRSWREHLESVRKVKVDEAREAAMRCKFKH